MSMKPWNAEALEEVADDLDFVARKLREVSAEMRKSKFEALVIQADAAFTLYRRAFLRLAGSLESEFRDQFRAEKMGTVPRWKINQKVVEARRAAKAERKEKGLEQPPTKKAKKA